MPAAVVKDGTVTPKFRQGKISPPFLTAKFSPAKFSPGESSPPPVAVYNLPAFPNSGVWLEGVGPRRRGRPCTIQLMCENAALFIAGVGPTAERWHDGRKIGIAPPPPPKKIVVPCFVVLFGVIWY